MREVHRELRDLQGTVNPLDALGERMAKRFKLICFDEFHVADITDAMILHRLLVAMQHNDIGFVTTSNFKPDALYPDGLHRERLLPAIELLNQTMDIIEVDHGTDYRGKLLEQAQLYLTPCSESTESQMQATFDRLAEAPDQDGLLMIEERKIWAKRRAGAMVWFDFKVLCGGPRSQNDFLEIASQFHTVFLSGVPRMEVRMASEARRFTWLVDVLYDRHVKLVLQADVPPEELYPEGPYPTNFRAPHRACGKCNPPPIWPWRAGWWILRSHEALDCFPRQLGFEFPDGGSRPTDCGVAKRVG
jgi:cell division protein ZapE